MYAGMGMEKNKYNFIVGFNNIAEYKTPMTAPDAPIAR